MNYVTRARKLALPTQGYSALFVSILSGESKELITMIKAWVQQ